MRRLAGLQIDFRAATGSVTLPPEFMGQPAEFRASVLHDWCKDLMAERDMALEAVAHDARHMYHASKSQSLQAILQSGWSVVCQRTNEATGKTALWAFRKTVAGMESCIFESFGASSFAPLQTEPLHNAGIKRLPSIAAAALKEWNEWRRFMQIKGAVPASVNTFGAWKAARAYTSQSTA